MRTVTVAIGGNAIMHAGEEPSHESQSRNIMETCRHLAAMIRDGYDMVITHGNGPQVGNIILQNELCRDRIPAMPLDVCVAMSQGQLGYMIKQALTSELCALGLHRTVVCILTSAIVDPDDPALERPTKPIGPYYDEAEAARMARERGWTMGEDARRGGWRRLIPSPEPLGFVESHAIRRLVFQGDRQDEVVIASGGGGIPVVRSGPGFRGVEAVIDKDLSGAVLANAIEERLLVMLTDIDAVYLDLGTERQRRIDTATVGQMQVWARDGHFGEGTMLPKVRAAVRFLEGGGERVIITNPESLPRALEGAAGTELTRGP